FGFASATTSNMTIGNETTGGRIKMADASGVHYPAAGEENLRIIRGKIGGDGTILQGSGFSVQHPDVGTYAILYDTPFLSSPVITVAAEVSGEQNDVAAQIEANSDTRISVTIGTMHITGDSSTHADRDFHFIAIGPR